MVVKIILIFLLAIAGSVFFIFDNNFLLQLSSISKILDVDDSFKLDLMPMPPLHPITQVRAIYITANMAKHTRMEDIIKLIKKTSLNNDSGLNAVVIDVNDENGFQLDDSMRVLIKRLRFLQIFPIARFTVFQDNNLAKKKPNLAIKDSNGDLWQDRGKRYWLDPASREVWEHVLSLSKEVAKTGFGEINFDYIRFPSDGNLDDMAYPAWDKTKPKTEVILDFSRFIKENLKKEYPDLKLTADVFGYTLLRTYDLGIGQSVVEMSEIFDDICPMIYPSHYDSGNFNFENPAEHPYEVVYKTLEKGREIFEQKQKIFNNVRPWVQDFNLGAIYTPEMVRDQIRAINDIGLTRGWMIWNPNNKYREAIFDKFPKLEIGT